MVQAGDVTGMTPIGYRILRRQGVAPMTHIPAVEA